MEEIMNVEEAQNKLYTLLAEDMCFNYFSSKKCLKKVISDLVFEVDFYSNKWNKSGEIVEIGVSFILMYKKYGKERVNCVVASKSFGPKSGWYDISTQRKLENTFDDLRIKLKEIVDLCNRFEEDFLLAVEYLYNNLFDEYNVAIDFIVDNLGINKSMNKIKEIYLNIPVKEREIYIKIEKELNIKLKNGDMTCLKMDGLKTWMCNRSNWKYIMDNKFIVD